MRHYKPDAERMTGVLQVRYPKFWEIALMGEDNLANEIRAFVKRKYVDKKILKEKLPQEAAE